MTPTITSDLVEAYSQCPRKAFLMMSGVANQQAHEYVRIIDEQVVANRQAHRTKVEHADDFKLSGVVDLNSGSRFIADAELVAEDLHARCDFLTKVHEPSRLGRFSYEPVKIVGTYRASRADTL